MKIDKCKFSFHDYIIVDVSKDIERDLKEVLTTQGWKSYESGYCYKYETTKGTVYFILDNFITENYVVHFSQKICVLCGKIKKNYSLEKLIVKLNLELITKLKEHIKTQKAIDIKNANPL